MKKLMIVAAVAAMAGAAVAEIDYVYDFTASVKSTGGKQGKDTKSSYKIALGRDAGGQWWWAAAGYASDAEAKADFKKMDNDDKLAFEDILWDSVTKESLFPEPAQNGKPCYTLKFYEITPAVCYRVAKSYKLKDTVVFVDCCGDTDVDAIDGMYTINLLNRFGGMTYDKATKIEIDADVTGDLEGSNGGVDARFAGQGTIDKKDGYIKSISGNIAGSQAAPTCWECCDDDVDALAFECNGTEDKTLDTAIYGTWSMKYNKKASAELNK